MNDKPLQSLTQGIYGRKIAYTTVEEITDKNVLKILDIGISVLNHNRPIIRYLWNYYKGDQPARYRTKTVRDDVCNRVVENHAYEIVQFKTGQTYGEPVQYISRKDDDNINNSVDLLNDYMVDADKQSKDIKSGEWQSAVGTSFKAVQKVENGDIPFRIVVPTPLDTVIVYSLTTEEPMLAIQELKNDDGETYYHCYSRNMEFFIKGDKVVKSNTHAFYDIPIIEYPNNHERISDIELVIDLLDAINKWQSNRIDAVEQFVQSWVKFVNCDIDDKSFKKMKEMGALVVKSNNGAENKADVDIMTQELNQSESQVAKDDLLDSAWNILAVPSKQGNTGGDTQGAVELRNGWDFSKTRAKLKDPLVKSGDKKLGKIATNILRLSGEDLKLTIRDFDVQINHSPTDNMVVKCQALQYLKDCGIHPIVALKTVGLWGDVEKVFTMSKPYLDNVWKTLEQAEKEKQQEKAQELLQDFQNQNNLDSEVA